MHRTLLSIIVLLSFQLFSFAEVLGEYELKVDVDSVFLNVSVRERANNRSLTGLQKQDFQVFEDGVRQEIHEFLPNEAPFNLLLLLDVSGSTGSYLKMMKQAAIEFTHQINETDRVAVATFNSRVRLVQDFTGDRNEAERAIKRIKSGGGTAFYDALMTSADQYMESVQGRGAIVVFTDGIDNQLEGMPESGSRISFDELYRKVQEVDMIVYTIFLNSAVHTLSMNRNPMGPQSWPRRGGFALPFPFPFPANTGSRPSPIPVEGEDSIGTLAREQLRLIADQTGGRMYSPKKINELSGVYAEIADDLRIQYQVGYNSSNRVHNGKWRTIRVEVGDKPNAVVRTRPGYYARSERAESRKPGPEGRSQ